MPDGEHQNPAPDPNSGFADGGVLQGDALLAPLSEWPGAVVTYPRNLTHCATCDKPFPEPMIHWDDYFVELKDAGFVCEDCPEVYE